MDLDQLTRLRSPQGAEALRSAAALVTGDQLLAASQLRKQFGSELGAAALTQATLRRAAVAKFGPQAWKMYFTRTGLEQATRGVVANRRAERLAAAGVTRVADLGCGLGADLGAFVRSGLDGYGVEADPVTAECAALNVPSAQISVGDARDFDLGRVDGVFCDPARRSGHRRVFDPAAYSPPWDWVVGLPDRAQNTVLKLAPGIDQALLLPSCELELVSVDGDVVEAAAWCGPLAQTPRRATVIRGDKVTELTGTGLAQAPVGPTRDYIFDPDGAVVRAHLVAEFAREVSGTLADASIAYVWAQSPTRTPLARCFAVDEVMPFSLKRLRAALRSRDVGRLEILKRGSALDVQELRKSLRLNGSQEASLLLTRVSGAPVAVIAHVDSDRG